MGEGVRRPVDGLSLVRGVTDVPLCDDTVHQMLAHAAARWPQRDAAVFVEQGLRWIERNVTESGSNCASTFMLPEWLRERRADLVAEDQIARWQRVVDMLVVAGDSRVADLAD